MSWDFHFVFVLIFSFKFFIFWLVLRMTRKYIKVDVFGRCSGKFGQHRGCRNLAACLKTFKFYLAFENALCEDYITEKYWGRLGKSLSFHSFDSCFENLPVRAVLQVNIKKFKCQTCHVLNLIPSPHTTVVFIMWICWTHSDCVCVTNLHLCYKKTALYFQSIRIEYFFVYYL